MNNNYKSNNFFINELGSVVIGVLFSFLLIYFIGTEIFGKWSKFPSSFIETATITILIMKCISFLGWYLALEKYNEELQLRKVLMHGYALTIGISIVILDYQVYPEYNVSGLYTLLVPFGWFLKSKNGPVNAAVHAILLSFLVFFLREDINNFGLFFFDRITSIVVIAMVAIFLRYFKINKFKLKNSNKELNQKIIESEIKGKELEQYVYTVSHDLKEPLRSLSVILDIFLEGNKDILKEDDAELLSLVKNSTLRMGRSIQAMIDYSRLGQDFNLENVDLNKVVNDVVFDLDEMINVIDVDIDIKDLGSLTVFLKDFQLLFAHLIDNAIRFRDRNKKLIISISRRDIDDFAVFYIRDNGVGIEESNQERIFQIFQTLDASNERKGIGLAHCSKIAELHKGDISVESTLGAGCVFIVRISKKLI